LNGSLIVKSGDEYISDCIIGPLNPNFLILFDNFSYSLLLNLGSKSNLMALTHLLISLSIA